MRTELLLPLLLWAVMVCGQVKKEKITTVNLSQGDSLPTLVKKNRGALFFGVTYNLFNGGNNCKFMKLIITILLLLQSIFVFSQTSEIIKILNNELKKEIKHHFKNPNFDGDTISLVKEFTIDPNKILSVEIRRGNEMGYSLEKQEVPLSKIKIIGKDINIILETDEKDVKTITKRTYKNQEKEAFENNSSMFFTYLHFPHNEDVGDDLIKAFSKAGYKITKSYWYD